MLLLACGHSEQAAEDGRSVQGKRDGCNRTWKGNEEDEEKHKKHNKDAIYRDVRGLSWRNNCILWDKEGGGMKARASYGDDDDLR